jgi:RimJ/RimL family protein N-acetyltransferase
LSVDADDARVLSVSSLKLVRMKPGGSPWGGYSAHLDGAAVGECAFKSSPNGGHVEIAYHTFEEFERRGFATEMARQLVAIARRADPALVVVAQTLCETNASTKILTRLGFINQGTVHHPEDGDVLEWHLAPELPPSG